MYRSTAESFPFSRQVDGVGREKALGMSFGGNWGFSWNSSFHYHAVSYIFLGQISVSPANTPGPTQEGHTVILGFNERTHLVLKVGALQLGLLRPSKMSPPSLFSKRGTGCGALSALIPWGNQVMGLERLQLGRERVTHSSCSSCRFLPPHTSCLLSTQALVKGQRKGAKEGVFQHPVIILADRPKVRGGREGGDIIITVPHPHTACQLSAEIRLPRMPPAAPNVCIPLCPCPAAAAVIIRPRSSAPFEKLSHLGPWRCTCAGALTCVNKCECDDGEVVPCRTLEALTCAHWRHRSLPTLLACMGNLSYRTLPPFSSPSPPPSSLPAGAAPWSRKTCAWCRQIVQPPSW